MFARWPWLTARAASGNDSQRRGEGKENRSSGYARVGRLGLLPQVLSGIPKAEAFGSPVPFAGNLAWRPPTSMVRDGSGVGPDA